MSIIVITKFHPCSIHSAYPMLIHSACSTICTGSTIYTGSTIVIHRQHYIAMYTGSTIIIYTQMYCSGFGPVRNNPGKRAN